MREIRTYGSVRGAPGNRRPYRDLRKEVLTLLWAPSKSEALFLQHCRQPSSG